MLVYGSLEHVIRCVLCGVDVTLVLWVTGYIPLLFWEATADGPQPVPCCPFPQITAELTELVGTTFVLPFQGEARG